MPPTAVQLASPATFAETFMTTVAACATHRHFGVKQSSGSSSHILRRPNIRLDVVGSLLLANHIRALRQLGVAARRRL
jgi:hypothetical protein